MTFAPASPVKAAQVKSAEEEDLITTKSKSGPTSKKTSTRPHEEEQQEEEEDIVEVTPAVKPMSKAGASYNETRILVASFVAGSARCTCCSSAFSPGGHGKRCLGWYMGGVGYALGAGGGLRGAGPVCRALRWSCRMK